MSIPWRPCPWVSALIQGTPTPQFSLEAEDPLVPCGPWGLYWGVLPAPTRGCPREEMWLFSPSRTQGETLGHSFILGQDTCHAQGQHWTDKGQEDSGERDGDTAGAVVGGA